jgi:hypothetical protein
MYGKSGEPLLKINIKENFLIACEKLKSGKCRAFSLSTNLLTRTRADVLFDGDLEKVVSRFTHRAFFDQLFI